MADNEDTGRDLAVAAYNQNSETFRSLNALMWQVPLIAMTLTGGLWFGVATAKAPEEFRRGLLVLAGVGNLGLMAVLHRLRFVMGCYIEWFRTNNAAGFVAAEGASLLTRPRLVRTIFQTMLLAAAIISFLLVGVHRWTA